MLNIAIISSFLVAPESESNQKPPKSYRKLHSPNLLLCPVLNRKAENKSCWTRCLQSMVTISAFETVHFAATCNHFSLRHFQISPIYPILPFVCLMAVEPLNRSSIHLVICNVFDSVKQRQKYSQIFNFYFFLSMLHYQNISWEPKHLSFIHSFIHHTWQRHERDVLCYIDIYWTKRVRLRTPTHKSRYMTSLMTSFYLINMIDNLGLTPANIAVLQVYIIPNSRHLIYDLLNEACGRAYT